ncbi:MAG: SMC-Scp complex subunit ScpB [Pseudomonadota bacterium]
MSEQNQSQKKTSIDEAPEDIRNAVKQLSFAYQRSAETLFEAEEGGLAEAVRRAEAILFAAGEPLSAADIAASLPPGVDVSSVLMTLKSAYAPRGVSLVEVAGKWRFQTAEDLSFLFVEERQEQKKLTQASLETLAIIAYGQPVTRAEIEAVRGVAVAKTTLDGLTETGWVRLKGRRKTPGRPVTYGTTAAFLEHFGLESVDVLPGRADLEAEGLLSDVIPDGFFTDGTPIHHEDGDAPDLEEYRSDTAFVTDFLDDVETDADALDLGVVD